MPEVLIDNEFLTLWYHPQLQVVHHRFHQFMYGEAFRDGLLRGVDALREYGATKWLSDNRASSAVHPQDREWADSVWRPKALSAGWRHWAICPPSKVIGQMHMRDLVASYAETGLNVALFDGPESALKWLAEQ